MTNEWPVTRPGPNAPMDRGEQRRKALMYKPSKFKKRGGGAAGAPGAPPLVLVLALSPLALSSLISLLIFFKRHFIFSDKGHDLLALLSHPPLLSSPHPLLLPPSLLTLEIFCQSHIIPRLLASDQVQAEDAVVAGVAEGAGRSPSLSASC